MIFYINISCSNLAKSAGKLKSAKGAIKSDGSSSFKSSHLFRDSYLCECLLITIVGLSIFFFIKKTFTLKAILIIYLIFLITIFVILALVHLTSMSSKSVTNHTKKKNKFIK